jgi:hypothetical protein
MVEDSLKIGYKVALLKMDVGEYRVDDKFRRKCDAQTVDGGGVFLALNDWAFISVFGVNVPYEFRRDITDENLPEVARESLRIVESELDAYRKLIESGNFIYLPSGLMSLYNRGLHDFSVPEQFNGARIGDWVRHVAQKKDELARSLKHLGGINPGEIEIADPVRKLLGYRDYVSTEEGDLISGEVIGDAIGRTVSLASSVKSYLSWMDGEKKAILRRNGERADGQNSDEPCLTLEQLGCVPIARIVPRSIGEKGRDYSVIEDLIES